MSDHAYVSVFIAAPAEAQIEVLKQELLKRGLRVFTAYDIQPTTHSVADHINRAIKAADLIVGVVPETASPNVFFEIGVAYALQKTFLLLVSPKAGNIPSDLAGMLYVRADPDNAEAIGFALDQCLSRLKHKPVKSRKSPKEGRPLGTKADDFIAQLKRSESTIRGAELERMVADVLRAAGVTAVTQSPSPSKGADIAVWSDDLQPIAGNPLLIEVKTTIRTKKQLAEAVSQLERFREKSGSRLALLLVKTAVTELSATPFTGGVLSITIADLIGHLRSKTFSETIRELRNKSIHGGGK
jgi:Holliday junction resolvase